MSVITTSLCTLLKDLWCTNEGNIHLKLSPWGGSLRVQYLSKVTYLFVSIFYSEHSWPLWPRIDCFSLFRGFVKQLKRCDFSGILKRKLQSSLIIHSGIKKYQKEISRSTKEMILGYLSDAGCHAIHTSVTATNDNHVFISSLGNITIVSSWR